MNEPLEQIVDAPLAASDSGMLDAFFREQHTMPARARPHASHAQGAVSYQRDYDDSLTGEEFFHQYLSSLHGADHTSTVPASEQRDEKHGDVRLNHSGDQKEFEVKLERKGAETGRHALEFGEYDTDAEGHLQHERVPGWFRGTKADIVVPVVPMNDGTVVMYPYSVTALRRYLIQLSKRAHAKGIELTDQTGHLDYAKLLDAISGMIENSRHTLGPVNSLRDGGYKRSRSLCVPYEFLVQAGLSKPFRVNFE